MNTQSLKTATRKLGVTTPFYATVGAADLVIGKLRGVTGDAKARVRGLRSDLGELVEEQVEAVEELAERGETRVAELLDDSVEEIEIIHDDVETPAPAVVVEPVPPVTAPVKAPAVKVTTRKATARKTAGAATRPAGKPGSSTNVGPTA